MAVGDSELVAAPPDFLGLGVARAGTSWWYALLARHPRFHDTVGTRASGSLERYFDRELDTLDDRSVAETFARPAGTITGEWAPRCFANVWTGPVVRRVAPEAKLLVMLRDPVERYCSELAALPRDFHRVGVPRRSERSRVIAPGDEVGAFQRGRYDLWLGMLARSVDPGRVLVLQYEACLRAPEEQLARTVAFLGLEPMELDVGGTVRRPPTRRASLPGDREEQLVAGYRADVDALLRRRPELDRSLWGAFA
jgi:hypothetical protein